MIGICVTAHFAFTGIVSVAPRRGVVPAILRKRRRGNGSATRLWESAAIRAGDSPTGAAARGIQVLVQRYLFEHRAKGRLLARVGEHAENCYLKRDRGRPS